MAKPTIRKVIFGFDEKVIGSLEQIQRRRGFPSMAQAAREAIRISKVLQDKAEEGYSEIILRNPTTGDERVLIIASLQELEGNS